VGHTQQRAAGVDHASEESGASVVGQLGEVRVSLTGGSDREKVSNSGLDRHAPRAIFGPSF
jgi:hypothetical protein